MGKCLITKLKGTVEDISLPKIGFIVLRPKNENIEINIGFTEDVTLSTFGDAYFTDSTFSKNLGTTLSLKGYYNGTWGDLVCVHVGNGDGGLFVPLYSLRILVNISSSNKADFDTTKLAFASKSVARYTLNTDADFDFARMVNGATITYLEVAKTKKQDVSCINNVLNISERLSISKSSLYGDASVFSKFAKVDTILLPVTISGEISQINACNYGYPINTFVKNTWKQTRPSSNQIMAISGIDLGDDVDKMLIDQSACIANTQSQSWYHSISCKGNRTSSSDSAIAILQSKGYTVSVSA